MFWVTKHQLRLSSFNVAATKVTCLWLHSRHNWMKGCWEIGTTSKRYLDTIALFGSQIIIVVALLVFIFYASQDLSNCRSDQILAKKCFNLRLSIRLYCFSFCKAYSIIGHFQENKNQRMQIFLFEQCNVLTFPSTDCDGKIISIIFQFTITLW